MTRVRFPAIAGASFDLLGQKVTLVNHRICLLAGGGKIRIIQILAETLHVFVSMFFIVLTGLADPKLPGQLGSGLVWSGQVRSSRVGSGQVSLGQEVKAVRSFRSVRPVQVRSAQVRSG